MRIEREGEKEGELKSKKGKGDRKRKQIAELPVGSSVVLSVWYGTVRSGTYILYPVKRYVSVFQDDDEKRFNLQMMRDIIDYIFSIQELPLLLVLTRGCTITCTDATPSYALPAGANLRD